VADGGNTSQRPNQLVPEFIQVQVIGKKTARSFRSNFWPTVAEQLIAGIGGEITTDLRGRGSPMCKRL
jgi:hypothetical protein